ncbi:hypothetical protein K458DRAFT_421876 [Lentithecium fluviatile CBS 122367]|uniref:Uncharacterized protein n=1 Tax=Lentithecium fluviatile CBS 122367 TaxID=1168545 RepID=A0A6G1IQB9_9PLEO|nr:hypothetical protein K458DRAFT_421876 [Lentithecium fluviatile CBS 122367]
MGDELARALGQRDTTEKTSRWALFIYQSKDDGSVSKLSSIGVRASGAQGPEYREFTLRICRR